MKRTLTFALIFTLGMAAGAFAAKKGIDSSLFMGKAPKVAADALLEVAKTQAGKGSWWPLCVPGITWATVSSGHSMTDSLMKRGLHPTLTGMPGTVLDRAAGRNWEEKGVSGIT